MSIRSCIGVVALLAATIACQAQQGGLTRSGQGSGENAIPLTPDMIRELGRKYGESKRAQEEAATELAVPVSRRITVSFTPGQPTNIVQTVKGYPTALSFFDTTGEPWPIAWDTNSNPAGVAGGANCSSDQRSGGPAVAAVGFYVCTPVKGSNVLEIAPASLTPRGGLLVTLAGAPKPISFLLVAGGGKFDADLSVHVAERGPKAKVQIVTRSRAPETGTAFLTAMLDGVPPAEATPLMVSGVSPEDLRAWKLGDRVFLRTRLTLLSPEWTASENGAGGLTVYSVPATPVVLLSERGRTVSASLSEP